MLLPGNLSSIHKGWSGMKATAKLPSQAKKKLSLISVFLYLFKGVQDTYSF